MSRRRIGVLVAAAAVGAAVFIAVFRGPDAAEAVRDGYRAYMTALTARDGAEVAALVSSATLDHYSGLRDLALTADRTALGRERIVDQLGVLSMRASIPAEVLRTGDPRGVVAAAVGAQVISAGGAGTSLENVEVTGDSATGTVAATAGAPVTMWFRREDGTWKVELTALLAPAEASLQSARERLEEPAGDMLTRVMTKRVGEVRARALWAPLGREPGAETVPETVPGTGAATPAPVRSGQAGTP